MCGCVHPYHCVQLVLRLCLRLCLYPSVLLCAQNMTMLRVCMCVRMPTCVSRVQLHITLPEWVGQPQETCPALFFTFTDLTPGSDDLMMDKNREKALISALQSPTVAGMTVRRADGAPGAVVSIDTHEQTVLTAAIKALGKHMYGVQVRRSPWHWDTHTHTHTISLSLTHTHTYTENKYTRIDLLSWHSYVG